MTQVTVVLGECEQMVERQIVERLQKYESLLKLAEQRPQLEQEWPEQGQPPQKQREAPEELRYEAEKLADNDLGAKAASWRTQYQREKIEVSEGMGSCRGPNEGEPSGVSADAQEEPTLDAADAQEEPALDLNQSEENEVTADAHMVGSRRSTLLYGNRDEHEMIEGRPVYESTKVSEVLADASGGSGTEGGDSGDRLARLHFNFGEVVADDMQSKPFSGFSAVADDMQNKPFSGFIAKFEKEVSSSAGEVSVVAQDDALVDRVLAAVQAALRAELDASREVPGPIARMRCGKRSVVRSTT